MKRFLLFLALVFPLGIYAQYTLTLNDVEFSNGTITKFTNTTEKNIIIPRAFGDEVVYHIGDNVFFSKALTHVTIPNTILTIGYLAFYNYEAPYPVTFENNSNIIIIPKNSISGEFVLPTHANPNFHGYIHSGRVFQPGDRLKLNGNVPFFVDISYTLTDNDVVVSNNVIQSCSYDFKYKHIVIPSILDGQEVKEIGESVFEDKGIFKVTYPSTLKVIGSGAFQHNAFVSVDIPEGIKVIKEFAFGINWDNQNVNLPSTLDSIGSHAFYRNNIKTLTIPENLTYIGNWAFENNYIKTLTVPSNVKGIGVQAFYSNELTSVTFSPNSKLTYIMEDAFGDNEDLKKIALPTNTNTNFAGYINTYGKLFNAGQEITDFKSLYYANTPYTLTNDDVVVDANGIIQSCNPSVASNVIIIPDMLDGQIVKGIADFTSGSGLFYDKELFAVKLPSYIEKIGNNAFYNNYLTKVSIPNSVIRLGDYAFFGYKMLPIVLPEAKKSGFTFTYWIDTNGKKYLKGMTFKDFQLYLNAQFISGEILYPEFYSNKVETVIEEFIEFYDASVNVTTDAVYTWNFGDGEISHEKNPIHKYSTPGTYTVTLNISQNTDNKTVTHNSFIKVLPWYTLQDNDVEVVNGVLQTCSYNFVNKNIIIPEILDNQTVIGIGNISGFTFDGVFKQKEIERIQLPNSLTFIGHYALSGNKFENIKIPDKVTKIGEGAFKYCLLDSITLPNPTKTGYNLTGWLSPGRDSSYAPNTKAPTTLRYMNNKYDYLASFKIINYSINYNGLTGDFNPKTYTVENSITIASPKRPGYNFLGWYTNPAMTDTVGFPTLPYGCTGDTTFYVKWSIINYSITYHNVGKALNNNPSSYTVETAIRLNELNSHDSANYIFMGWYKNQSLTLKADSIVKGTTGPLNLYAKWLPDGDIVFKADTFSIKTKSPTCYGLKNGQITITSELFPVLVNVYETGFKFNVYKETPYTLENLASGTYHLSISVGGISRNFVVKIPSLNVIKSSFNVQGNTVSFNVEGGVPPYQIAIGNNNYYTETGQLTINNLNSGHYSVVIQDKNYCTDDAVINFDINNLNVFPNPVHNGTIYLTLPMTLNQNDNTYNIRVYNSVGVNLISKKCTVENNCINLDVSTLTSGNYFVEVKGCTFHDTKPFIVK